MNAKLKELLNKVKELKLDEGFNDTLIPGFKVIFTTQTFESVQSIYKPSLCVILQGAKKVIVGDKIYSYSPGEYIVASVEVPVTGQITKASPKEPYMCLMIELEPSMIFDVLKDTPSFKTQQSADKSGTYVSKVEDGIYDAFIRLIKCLDTPADANFLSANILREVIYRLVIGSNGEVVRQMGVAGSQNQRVTNAITILKKKFNITVNIEELAHEVGMSPSTFHKHFKDITNMSPLQYQKLIRLQEARRLLMIETGDAATVAFEVGYESPSQFNREYSRLFGKPPKQDMKSLKIGLG